MLYKQLYVKSLYKILNFPSGFDSRRCFQLKPLRYVTSHSDMQVQKKPKMSSSSSCSSAIAMIVCSMYRGKQLDNRLMSKTSVIPEGLGHLPSVLLV